jgi:membrane protease YdiL (CAAX protease family)
VAPQPAVRPGFQPPPGAEYPQILRGVGYRWWRSLLGVVLALTAWVLLTPLINQAVVWLGWATTAAGQNFTDYARRAYAFELPGGMLAANLAIVALGLVSWLLMALLHRVRPRWLSSVQPGVRWRYLLVCFALAVVTLIVVVLPLSLLLRPVPIWAMQAGFWSFLMVILLTSPLQAAAEEYFFRGYLLQALGSLVRQPWFGVVVSSLVFALLHGAQNAALFVDRLAIGLLAAFLVWRTGGLEAAIAIHVINNVFVYVIASLTTSVSAMRAMTESGWLDAVLDVGGFAAFTVAALLVTRRIQLRTHVDLASSQ